jgi:hypothetical protein
VSARARASRALAALLALTVPLAAPALGRVAVVAGANVGAAGRPKLWYAEKDADRLARTLSELGDFGPDQVEVVRGGGAEAFRAALARAEAKVAAARAGGERTLLVVFYSGHAGVDGLEFGAERVGYDELKAKVAASSAEARIVIVDACEAGTLTQVKGARAEAGVDFLLPVDEVRGTAFIASTAVGELAQESAAIGGSFFTHHLEVALRGAADANDDGLVTLAEAFRYTASATVADTSATRVGSQHPTYDFKMSGRGDVVLADLRRAEARLVVPKDPGALYLFKGPRGLMAEVPAGPANLTLAVPAGHYAVERRAPEGRATGELALDRGEVRLVPRLTPTGYAQARAKGGPLETEWWVGAGGHLVGLKNAGLAPAVRAGLRRELGPLGLVLHLDGASADVHDGNLTYGYTRVGGGLTALLPLAGGRTLLEGGLDLGGGWDQQALRDGRHFQTGDAVGAAALRLSRPIGSFRAAVDLLAGGRILPVNGKTRLVPALTVTLVVLYGTGS